MGQSLAGELDGARHAHHLAFVGPRARQQPQVLNFTNLEFVSVSSRVSRHRWTTASFRYLISTRYTAPALEAGMLPA
jgi:hypothetical protein